MSSYLICFTGCLKLLGLLYPFFLVLALAIIFLFCYLVKRRFGYLMANQAMMTGLILFSIAVMECGMLDLIWIYLGVVLAGAALLGIAGRCMELRLLKEDLVNLTFLSDVEGELGARIEILNTQRIKAYAFGGRIYLSMGLLERLDKAEIKAVAAHELYHLRKSPNKLLTTVLSLASLTFLRYDDEYDADRFAAKIAGADSLCAALRKLNVKGCERRARRLEWAFR